MTTVAATVITYETEKFDMDVYVVDNICPHANGGIVGVAVLGSNVYQLKDGVNKLANNVSIRWDGITTQARGFMVTLGDKLVSSFKEDDEVQMSCRDFSVLLNKAQGQPVVIEKFGYGKKECSDISLKKYGMYVVIAIIAILLACILVHSVVSG